jgi:hypothetical protein
VSDRGRWAPPTASERLAILRRTRRVAVVGASANPARPSYFVATYLVSSSCDYEIFFVNPKGTEILGRPCYPSLADLPVPPDIVDVFRRSEERRPSPVTPLGAGHRHFGPSSACPTWSPLSWPTTPGSTSSWTGASRSSTPVFMGACTSPGSIRELSRRVCGTNPNFGLAWPGQPQDGPEGRPLVVPAKDAAPL